ncbi:MFS transporter [Salinisphaera hydrothermalis]|uniref:MFS transporter n=1 Tax=Salinisphaera hydrothermalis TaxID=563188 RepID=UPI00334292D3
MNISMARHVSYGLLATAFFIGFFNRFAPASFSLPISRSFGLSAGEIGSLAATHFWVYTLMQIPAGLIVDRIGIRLPAAAGTLLTGAGALTLGLAPTYPIALAGPGLVGFGMSIVFVAMMKNNAIWFEGRRFGLITGVTLLVAAIGSMAAEAPANALLQRIDWRSIFIVLGALTIAVGVLIGLLWRPPDRRWHPGAASLTPSSESGLAPSLAWHDVLRSPQLWLVLLALSGTNGTFYAFAGLWGTQVLGDGFGLSGNAAAWSLTAALVPYGLGSLLVGQLSDRLRTRKTFVLAASLLNALAWAALLFAPWSHAVLGLACFLALGLSSAQVVVSFAVVKESVSANIVGLALALVNMGVFLTTAVVQMGYGWALSWVSDSVTPQTGLRTALWLPAIISFAGLAAAVRIRETHPARERAIARPMRGVTRD